MLFQLAQWGYVRFQVGVANYRAIYGAMATLPIFLVWIYIAWSIILFGAELTASIQRGDIPPMLGPTSPNFLYSATMHILIRLADRAYRGGDDITSWTLSRELFVPEATIKPIIDGLKTGGFVIEADPSTGSLNQGLFLARQSSTIVLADAIKASSSITARAMVIRASTSYWRRSTRRATVCSRRLRSKIFARRKLRRSIRRRRRLSTKPISEPKVEYMEKREPRSSFVNVNGVRLHTLDWGGDGAPIVIVHATGFLGRIYRPLAERLHAIGHVYSYDQRGHGDSSAAPDTEYSWAATMLDLEGFITAMGWSGVRAVGHSAGATAIGSLAASARI